MANNYNFNCFSGKSEKGEVLKKIRNKFDTENVITKNERLIQRQLWLIIVTISVVVIAILLFVLRSQRAKNKELELYLLVLKST